MFTYHLAFKLSEDFLTFDSHPHIKNSYFNRILVHKSLNLIKILKTLMQAAHINSLLTVIYMSRTFEDINIASSNALTILNRIRYQFTNLDLSNCKFPYADLSYNFYYHCNFSNCDLSYANFANSQLLHSNFENSDMKFVDFGIVMQLKSHYSSVLCTSIDKNAEFLVSSGHDKTLKL